MSDFAADRPMSAGLHVLAAVGNTPLLALQRIVPKANVVAALRVAERLGEGKTVATILVDSGLRYLSTGVFKEQA